MSLIQVLTNLANTLEIQRVNEVASAVGERVHLRLTPVSELAVLDSPVSVKVKWKVWDRETNGSELSVTAFGTRQNTSIEAPVGVTLPEVTLIFPVETVELTTEVPPPTVYWVEAQVRLHYAQQLVDVDVYVPQGEDTYISLPRFPIPVAHLAVPTILALFQHSTFRGFVVVSVPSNSPLALFGGLPSQAAVRELATFLQVLRSTVSHLVDLPVFAYYLIGLNQLSEVISSAPHFRFVPAEEDNNGVPSLEDIYLGYRDDGKEVDAEDRISSLLAIGPKNRSVTLFSDPNYEDEHGAFRVTVGAELFVLLRDFDREVEDTAPETVPADRSHRIQEPSAGKFDDKLSSFYFDWDELAPVVMRWPRGEALSPS